MSKKRILAIDSQKLNTIQYCARKYDYFFQRNLKPLVPATYHERGSLVHKMLAHYYILKKKRVNWHPRGYTHEDIIKICLKIGRHFGAKMDLPIEEVERTLEVFTEYCAFYEHEGWEVLAVEQVASKVIFEDEEVIYIYDAKPDLIVRASNLPILPVDHKHVRSNREVSPMSNQFIGYCWILGAYNLCVNRIGFQKTLPMDKKFTRIVLSYDQGLIKDWVENTIWWMRLIEHFMSTGYWPMDFSSCDKFDGCIFQDICVSDPLVRDIKLHRAFDVVEPWDVAKRL